MSEVFERIIELEPAYDKRHPDPGQNYGIHGVNLRMVLKGLAGAVQFLVYTNWQLPHVTREFVAKTAAGDCGDLTIECRFLPMPADVGYHSPTPRYGGQEPISESCPYLDGRPCYYDGSSMAAERVYRILLTEGSVGVWRELADYYRGTFEATEAGNG